MTGKLTSCVVAGNMVVAVAIMAICSAVHMVVKVSLLQGLRLQMEWCIAVGVMERVDWGAFAFFCKVHGFVWIWASLDEDEEGELLWQLTAASVLSAGYVLVSSVSATFVSRVSPVSGFPVSGSLTFLVSPGCVMVVHYSVHTNFLPLW